jgi:hypothetical protein
VWPAQINLAATLPPTFKRLGEFSDDPTLYQNQVSATALKLLQLSHKGFHRENGPVTTILLKEQ